MRCFVFALLGATALATGAQAGAAPAPIVVPFNWTGFYGGVHAGGSWSAEGYDYNLTDPTGGTPLTSRNFATCGAPAGVGVPTPTSPNPFDLQASCSTGSSFLGGGQVGYNWQSGSLVYGVELDGSWRDLSGHHFGVFGANPTVDEPMGTVVGDTMYSSSQQNSLGTLRGRIGYAPGNWLFYVTGGLAVGGVEHAVTEVLSPGTTCITPSAPGAPTDCRNASDSDIKVGWTIGAGIEVAPWRNWSIGAEYLYTDLGSTTLTMAPLAGADYFTNVSTTTFHDQSHMLMVKLNYHFGGM